ncbi:MAG: hypothetical protein MUC42_08265 [Bryobacter sp.]|nr:hypothetical protein [Bryobacter sp.]
MLDAPASGGTYSIAVATPCSNWTAVSPVSWIQITSGAAGNGNGSITYVVQPNQTTQARTANLTIGTTTFAVRQVGAACTFSVAPATVNVSAAGGSGQFNITTIAGCTWGVSSSVPWARATVGSTGGTQGTANFTVDANPTVEPRSGTFTIAGQVIPIEQAGQPMTITAAGIVNAASFKGTSIAPGEILSIFGIGIGPANPVSMQLNADRTKVLDQIGETRVLFDGTPSPMVFTSSGQVSCVVPYSMAGRTSVPIEVEYQGRKSNRVSMPVLPTSPGLFTINASGSGQGAFLNQNGSVNGPANPAQRGQVIVLYGTGDGVLRPPLADGAIAPLAEPFPRPVVPVTVRIGNLEAQVAYAGSAPGLVAGAFQINAVIPATAPVGAAIPVQVIIGGVESPAGVTFAVR